MTDCQQSNVQAYIGPWYVEKYIQVSRYYVNLWLEDHNLFGAFMTPDNLIGQIIKICSSIDYSTCTCSQYDTHRNELHLVKSFL